MDSQRLKERILEDGKLSLKEANKWFRHGQGKSLTVDASKIDLDFINPDNWNVGETKVKQTLFTSKDGRVYGNLTLTYEGNSHFSINPDIYDFETHHGLGLKTWFRNQATKVGSWVAGSGKAYKINFSGFNKVNHSPFVPQYPTGYKF